MKSSVTDYHYDKGETMWKSQSKSVRRQQKAWKVYKNDDVSSPTGQQESLIISMMIDAKEGRDVATVDIVGAYLLAQMNNYVLVKLTGKPVETMCIISNTYKKYVTVENGKRYYT